MNVFVAEREPSRTRITFNRSLGGGRISTWSRGEHRGNRDSVIFIFHRRRVSHYLAGHGTASWSRRVSAASLCACCVGEQCVHGDATSQSRLRDQKRQGPNRPLREQLREDRAQRLPEDTRYPSRDRVRKCSSSARCRSSSSMSPSLVFTDNSRTFVAVPDMSRTFHRYP